MILHDTGIGSDTRFSINRRALDERGKAVLVTASKEVIQHQGYSEVWRKAERKYDGSGDQVIVKNDDF